MNRSLRTVSALAFAATLAACSGGGGTSTTPIAPQSHPIAPTGVNPFALVENGVAVPGSHIMPSAENRRLVAMAHSGGNAGTGGNLIYGGGAVQRNAKIYLVFWGWSSDPNGEQALLTKFVSGLNGSSWSSTVTQYSDKTGSIANDAAYGGSWSDTSSKVPSRPGQSAVAAEAAKAAAHFGDYSVDADYFVALPTGHDPSGFKTQWCAFHSTTSANGSTIYYTDFPYTSDAGASCGSGSVNSPGTEDGVTIVGGHEIEEAVTDPQPSSGWVDSAGSEIGDKCAWVSLQNTSFSTGTFPTQPLWSNAISGCAQ